MTGKLKSFFLAASIGLLAVAPPIPYNIPLIINSFGWLYMVVAAGLFGFFWCSFDQPMPLKVLVIYLFFASFLSQAPYLSFNAFTLLVLTLYFYWACRHSDYDLILKMVEAVFWLEIMFLLVQQLDKDTLMSFDPSEAFRALGITTYEVRKKVFYGTVFQPMRLASLFAVMAPLLVLKRKIYIVPLLILAYCSGTLGFAFALLAGILVYTYFKTPDKRWFWLISGLAVVFGTICTLLTSDDAFRVAFTEGRIPVWLVCLKSWALDTTGPVGKPDIFGISQTGPFDPLRFFFGHGMDTFLPLFPIYKHDPNPFPQAHNDWIHLAWETGLIGFAIFTFWYCAGLLRRLYKAGEYLLISGLTTIAVNMCFAFPWRMTQTVLLMVAYVAFCEKKLAPTGAIRGAATKG